MCVQLKNGFLIATIISTLFAAVVGAAPIGKKITLKNVENGKYVTVDASSADRLEARLDTANTDREEFLVEDVGGGAVLLKSVATGNYVRVDTSSRDRCYAVGTSASETAAQFQWTEFSAGVVRLQSLTTMEFVRVAGAANTLRANSLSTGTDTQFEWEVSGGPGFPNVTQTSGAMLSDFRTDPVDDELRTVVLDYIDGYLYMDTRFLATGDSGHSLQTWDISDPANPIEVARVGGERGMHKSTRFLPDYRVNNQGDKFYNVSDMLNIVPENPAGYSVDSRGTRGAYLLPFEYFSGHDGNTIEIVDTRLGDTPVSSISAHGFLGQTIPIGNLLIVSGIRSSVRGVATYDISNPAAPVLLDVISPSSPLWSETAPSYESFVWKNFIVLPNVQGTDDVEFVDFSDPTDLKIVTKTGDLPGITRYAQFQDNHMFLGWGKYDLTPVESGNPPTLVGTYEQAGEYMLPLGNLLVCAENTHQNRPYGSRIFAHQAAPDTNPPTVAYHSPAAGATNQAVTSRVGIVIHETLDYATINPTTFRVFPVGGGADLTGTLNAMDKDVLTFTPDVDLEEGTTYRVLLEAGGIKDAAGNGIAEFSFDFTTAGAGSAPPILITDVSNSSYPAPVGGSTNLSVVATGGQGALSYSWDFGDGSPATGFSTSSQVSHTYASAGHYTARVQVRDSSEPPQISTQTIVVTATTVPSGPLSTKGSQILVDESSRLVWCVNPDNNTVTAMNADTLTKVLEVSVGKDPRSIAQASNGDLWVTCLDDDRIDILDGTSGAVLNSIDLHRGSRPHDVVFNSAKTYAYVSLKGSGKVVRIDPVTRLVDATLDAGATPTAVAVSSGGNQLLVNRFISPDTSGEVRSFDNAGNGSIALDQTMTLAIDTVSEDSGDGGRGLPNYLADIAIDPGNDFAYVTSKQDNIARGQFRDGLPLTHDTSVRAILSKIDLSTNTEVFSARIDIDDASQPSALLFSPLGDYLFVAIQGNNEVKVLDAFNGNIVVTLPAGLAPQGLAFDSVTNQLFVKNLMDRTVVVHDLSQGLQEGEFGQPPVATIPTVATETMTAQVLFGKQVFYNAADERMSFEGYLSCAACHQDGDHDGRTWDFTDRGEGLRNTSNLRGRAGMGHGNVHWSANFDEIQDFELDIVGGFGGNGFISSGGPNPSLGAPNAGRSVELDALAAYVTSLGLESIEISPYRNGDGTLTAEAAMGKQLFEGTVIPASGTALSCVTCHDPATAFTDSVVGDGTGALHDVGTIKASSGARLGGGASSLSGIDTPTLLGLHASEPYLHDGSAATIAGVFDQFDSGAALGQDGSAHDLSVTGYNLTASEKDDLIAYLMQIDGSPDVTAPLEPSGLLSSAGNNSVSLNWDDNTESDFASYNVYRSLTPGDFGSALVTGLTSSDYIDFTALNGVTYYYAVTAVDALGNESVIVNETSATPFNSNPSIRVTEYYLTTGDFSGTTATVTLDQALADDYFILVRGSRAGNNSSFPNNDYARVVSVPGGKGDLADSGSNVSVGLQRAVADVDWEGVVTVVECQNASSPGGFTLVDVLETSMTSTSGTDSSAAWDDVNQVVLFGGYRGGGVEMSGSPTNRKEGTGCYTRVYPSGSNTLNWTRDAGGEIMFDATMTTFVVEWGSEWTVQHVNVVGNSGGDGADVVGEYTTAAINPVARANTWVWGTGTRVDSGTGDCAEACLITLGDGVAQNATESTVAVGSEYTDAYDFDVYALTHAALSVEHHFKSDGDSASSDLPIGVGTAAVGARFGWVYNGCNRTNSGFPRPRMWARYTDGATVTISRGRSGQTFPAWVQGIDLSGLNN